MRRLVLMLLALVSLGMLSTIGLAGGQMTYEQAINYVAQQGIQMWTVQGAPDPHRGHYCWSCHGYTPPQVKNVMAPQEPCANCHAPLTAEQERIADQMCRMHGSICPLILRYLQPDGSMVRFFFGIK